MKLAKRLTVILLLLKANFCFSLASSSNFEARENILNELDKVQQSVALMQEDQLDPEFAILHKFKPILSLINSLDGKQESEMDQLSDQVSSQAEFTEFFSEPWQKFREAKGKIGQFFALLQHFANNKVYVDEVVIDDFTRSHKSNESLDVIHDLIVSQNWSNGLLFKLYQELRSQVE